MPLRVDIKIIVVVIPNCRRFEAARRIQQSAFRLFLRPRIYRRLNIVARRSRRWLGPDRIGDAGNQDDSRENRQE